MVVGDRVALPALWLVGLRAVIVAPIFAPAGLGWFGATGDADSEAYWLPRRHVKDARRWRSPYAGILRDWLRRVRLRSDRRARVSRAMRICPGAVPGVVDTATSLAKAHNTCRWGSQEGPFPRPQNPYAHDNRSQPVSRAHWIVDDFC